MIVKSVDNFNCQVISLFRYSPGTNAFSVLMMNARLIGQRSLPSSVAEPKNKKDVLRNDVIAQLSELGLKWRGNDVSSAGETLVRSLTNCLWYIDGHHEVLAKGVLRSQSVFGGTQATTDQSCRNIAREP